jgi:pseudouridine-5'-phosphate glycosidase/pseudouridine kinase
MLCHVRNSAGVSKLSSLSSPCRAIGSLRKQARRRFTCCSPLHKPRENANYKYDPRVFRVSEEVEEAVQSRRPVVALETTIYTHGFPYPDNVALAALLESVVRKNGGVPATIGVLNGVARVGLSPEELIELASSDGKTELMKVSRRDLPYITGLGLTGRKINGGTTIAGTMVLAHMAGIEVFGTGGLGGVHRGGEHTMDVSADLTELGRTGVTVISSGCKSFLDIPRTLEYLETQGAFVGTFADGRSGKIDFPAFWTRESGLKSPTVIQNEKEAAAIICKYQKLWEKQ